MSDALDRIKQRKRPSVPPRDTAIASSPDTQKSRYTDSETHLSPDIPNSRQPDPETPRRPDTQTPKDPETETSTPPEFQDSRHTEVQTHVPELVTKRSTFRLEADLIERLHAYCRQQGISREVLIEAMFEHMEAHPDTLATVVQTATAKHEQRQQAANRKRAEKMMEKFGS